MTDAARTLTDADVAAIADEIERRLRPKRMRRTSPAPVAPTREDDLAWVADPREITLYIGRAACFGNRLMFRHDRIIEAATWLSNAARLEVSAEIGVDLFEHNDPVSAESWLLGVFGAGVWNSARIDPPRRALAPHHTRVSWAEARAGAVDGGGGYRFFLRVPGGTLDDAWAAMEAVDNDSNDRLRAALDAAL